MSIFRNKSALEHSYVPDRLPMRETERKKLLGVISEFFSSGGTYKGILVYGSFGTGKTVLSRRIAYDLESEFSDLLSIYVNCRFSRRVYRVLSKIVEQISPDLPHRGLARDEFLELIFLSAREKADKMLLILDEIDSLFWGNEGKIAADFLYSISRFWEQDKGGLSLVVISISRDQTFLYQWLDAATRSSYIQEKLILKKYNAKELQEILEYRAELALIDGAVTRENIMFLADFVADQVQGNARVAIDLLRKAAELAEAENSSVINTEHIRRAMKEHIILPHLDDEILLGLGKQKLLLILATIRALKALNKPYVTRREVYGFYKQVCEEYNEKPRRNTQIWRYLREINHDLGSIIRITVSGQNQRGRSTRISISVPIDSLEKVILSMLEKM